MRLHTPLALVQVQLKKKQIWRLRQRVREYRVWVARAAPFFPRVPVQSSDVRKTTALAYLRSREQHHCTRQQPWQRPSGYRVYIQWSGVSLVRVQSRAVHPTMRTMMINGNYVRGTHGGALFRLAFASHAAVWRDESHGNVWSCVKQSTFEIKC